VVNGLLDFDDNVTMRMFRDARMSTFCKCTIILRWIGA
jgi:uncharacterized protein YqiB (DUF1249 family)